MTAAEKIAAEVAKYEAILARRGQFWEDEQASYTAYKQAHEWLEDDKAEERRIEAEAAAAEEQEKLNDPHLATKELFGSYRTKLKKEGRV